MGLGINFYLPAEGSSAGWLATDGKKKSSETEMGKDGDSERKPEKLKRRHRKRESDEMGDRD